MQLPEGSEILEKVLVSRRGRPMGTLIIYKHCDKIRVAGRAATPVDYDRIQQIARRVQKQYGSHE